MDRDLRVTGTKRTSNRGHKKLVSTPDSFNDDVSVEPVDSDGSTEPDFRLFLKSFKSLGDLSINDDDVDGGGNNVYVDDEDDIEYKAVDDDYDDDAGCKSADDDDADAGCKSADDDDDDDEDKGAFDQDYLTFLKNLREFGTAYTLAVTGNDGRSVCVKYEEDDEHCDDYKRKSSKKVDEVDVVDVPSSEKVKGLDKTRWRKSRSEVRNDRPAMHCQSPARDPKVPSRRRGKQKDIEDEVRVEYMDTAVPKPGPKTHNLSQHKTKLGKQVFREDQHYTYFLNCLREDGDSYLFKTDHGDQIRYESDDGSASDSDIEISGVQFLKCDVSSKNTRSEFKEKLMAILVKPFDKHEYDQLRYEISERKPLEKHRELRNNSTKRCQLDGLGKSYIDHYADFKRKFKGAHSDHKALNLLRGFFYWLKNCSNKDAFQPWLDEACMKVLPGC